MEQHAAQPCKTCQENAGKMAVYETNIEEMLRAIQDRLDELEGKELTDFDQGRQLAFTEMLDIISTRHRVILDVLG